jgi:hypothetical protein
MPITPPRDWLVSHDQYRPAVWFAFGVFWAIDLSATVVFFSVPYLYEQNVLTVLSYRLFGLAGVGIAAVCYAAVALGVTRALSERLDAVFLTGVTLLYAVIVLHNVTLLVQTTPMG